MSLTSQHFYRFFDFELQPSRRALLRDGVKISIAPKTFEVLLCLVQSAGRVVLKEELLKTVWPESFVEESNLTQHIFWLRRALGDRAEAIATIPGRGYEFVAPVQAIAQSTETSTGPGVSFTVRQSTEVTHVLVEESAVPGGVDLAEAGQLPSSANWKALLLSWPAYAALAVLVLAAIAFGVYRYHHRVIPGDHHEVVLADFENNTGNPDFDRALKTLLAIDLGQSPSIAVASEGDTRKVLALMNHPADSSLTPAIAREVCIRLNDQVVLSGLIARFGEKYLITLTATDCAGGKDLVQTKAVAADRDSVMKAVDSVAAEMLRRLGEPLQSLKRPGQQLLLAHTSSLDALRAYSQARALHVKLKFADAVPLYQRAIELDPNFADAHAQLANCYNNLGEALKGRDEMGRAYQLRDQASDPDRLKITAMYEYWKTGDRHQAIRNYQAWAEMYPLQPNPWVLLGQFQESVGRVDLAVEAEKHAVALKPDSADANTNLADVQRLDGQLDEAKQTCLNAFSHGVETVELHRELLDIALLQNDNAAFQQQMAWLQANSPQDAEQAQADVEASQGKLRSAVTHYEHLVDAQEKDGMHETALQTFVWMPDLEFQSGLVKEAREHFKRYEPLSPLTGWALTEVIVTATELGEMDLAEKRLTFMRGLGKHDSDVLEIFVPESSAAIDIAQGKPQQALTDMEPTAPYELSDPTVPDRRGRAYIAAKNYDAAAAEFRTIINRPYTSGTSPNVALAHLNLARVLAAQGTRAAARQEYEAFFTLWKDADPDLPILKQAHAEYEKVQPILPLPK